MKKIALSIFAIVASVFLFTSCNKEDLDHVLTSLSSAKVTIGTPEKGDIINYEFKSVLAATDNTNIYVVATTDTKTSDSSITYPSLSVSMKTKDADANTYKVSVPTDLISSIFGTSSLNIADLKNALDNSVILALSPKTYQIMTDGRIELTTNESSSKKGTFSGNCIFVNSDDLLSLATATKKPISGSFTAVSISVN